MFYQVKDYAFINGLKLHLDKESSRKKSLQILCNEIMNKRGSIYRKNVANITQHLSCEMPKADHRGSPDFE